MSANCKETSPAQLLGASYSPKLSKQGFPSLNKKEKYLNSDRDSYKKEIENEIDVLEDVIDMDMNSSKIYDYVGKFLPTKIILRTRIPAKWESCENFLKEIWERINKRIPKGKISEDKEGKD